MKKLFPDDVVVQTKHFRVAQDWEVPIPAFFIISSIRKVRSIAEFTDEETVEFALLIRNVRRGMQEVNKCEEVYLFQNEDSVHGFHLWMLPRYAWMESFGRKVQSVRPILEYAAQMPITDEVMSEVREKVHDLKEYLKDSQSIAA